jgi:hypothetical protein
MPTYVTPEDTHHHYVERDTGSNAGIWAVLAVLIVLFALLFFGSNLFGRGGGDGGAGGSINIETPSGSGSGTGGTTGQ